MNRKKILVQCVIVAALPMMVMATALANNAGQGANQFASNSLFGLFGIWFPFF